MKQQPRIYYTETGTLMWDRWQKGESRSIARHFGRGHSSVQRVLGETGGMSSAEETFETANIVRT